MKKFLNDLWKGNNTKICVVKPYRGVASDGNACFDYYCVILNASCLIAGVFKCTNIDEAMKAFENLNRKPLYGGGLSEGVLVQEYADGTEYAVDTVSADGEIKVVALWRYALLSCSSLADMIDIILKLLL
jgi:hypothetical protein